MAMNGINLLRRRGISSEVFRRQGWLLLVLWALSPYSVESAVAARVCTTNSDGKTVCYDKLSAGIIVAIIITIVLFLLLCAGIFYVVRRTRIHRMNNALAANLVIPTLGYSGRRTRRDEEEGGDDDSDDDEKYLSVEKNQIHGPAWEARYDPSSAPLPGKGSSSWSSRLRTLKSGGTQSGSEFGGYGHQPVSAPGHGQGRYAYSRSAGSVVRKPRSAGAEPSVNMAYNGGKRHWGNLIHGSLSQNGSMSACPTGPSLGSAPPRVRARPSPGLHIIAEGPGGAFNAPVIPPLTPHTPRTPSRLGTAPPLSAGPGFASAANIPRTPRTAGTTTPLTPRPVLAYSPVTPRGPIGAI
jgi:hypothetical protein